MSEITRTVTVFDQNTQEKTVIENVVANTFGELKEVLRSNGIYVEGMDVREGISRVDLKSDAAMLPHDTPYRGGTTSDLMILLTKTNKKVASGIGRTEAVEFIKDNELEVAVKVQFGKNWTNVSTPDLISFVEKYEAASKEEKCCDEKEVASCGLVEAVRTLVEDLWENDYISDRTYDTIERLLAGKADKPKDDSKGFSQDEIYAALRDM